MLTLSPTIGAEIDGVDLRDELGDDTIAEIRSALLRWKVIFFRDQDITAEQHIAFARRFGELEIHPATPAGQEHPEVLRIVTVAGDRPFFDPTREPVSG